MLRGFDQRKINTEHDASCKFADHMRWFTDNIYFLLPNCYMQNILLCDDIQYINTK